MTLHHAVGRVDAEAAEEAAATVRACRRDWYIGRLADLGLLSTHTRCTIQVKKMMKKKRKKTEERVRVVASSSSTIVQHSHASKAGSKEEKEKKTSRQSEEMVQRGPTTKRKMKGSSPLSVVKEKGNDWKRQRERANTGMI